MSRTDDHRAAAGVTTADVRLPDGTVLAVRVHPARRSSTDAPDGAREDGGTQDGGTQDGTTGGALLVHGLASNARMWDACAAALAGHGVDVVAVDLRGHGASARHLGSPPPDTTSAATDVSALLELLRDHGTLSGPVLLAGQSWGGNVVLTAAAGPGRVPPAAADALVLVDGGWLRFDQQEPFERLWQRMAPPTWDGTTWDQLLQRLGPRLQGWGPHALTAVLGNLTTREDGTVRNVLDLGSHERILRSMYDADPRLLYPRVQVPTLLVPAGEAIAADLLQEAVTLLPDARVQRYPGAHHDLHLQHPVRLAGDLAAHLRAAARAAPVPPVPPATPATTATPHTPDAPAPAAEAPARSQPPEEHT